MKKKGKKKETYSPQKHEWGTKASDRFARNLTPGQKSEQTEKPMKTFSDIYEAVKSADKKPQNYKDPETGKVKTRMVPVDKEIVKESHFKVGQKVKCKASGMTGTVTKVDPEEKGKYYTVRQDSGKVMKYSPDELTAVQKESAEQTEANSQVDDWKKVQSMDKGSLSSKDGMKKRVAHLKSVADYHKKYGNKMGAKKAMDQAGKINRNLVRMVGEDFPYRDMSDTGADEESQMAIRQLHFIQYAAEEIMDYVEMRGDLDEWFQNKLSAVHSKIQGLHSFIEGDKRAMGMDEEVIESKDNKLKVGSKSAKDYRDSEKDNPVGGVRPKSKIKKYYKPRKEKNEGFTTPQQRGAMRLAKRAAERDAAGKSRKLSPSARQAVDKVRGRAKKKVSEEVDGTRILSEPATSKAQQQAAGAALAAKRGDIDPSKLKGASRDMYKSMSKKELDDFASTKHKGLPTRKESNELGVLIPMEYDENNNLVPKQEGSALWDIRKKMSNNED